MRPAALATVILTAACNPVYAPPVRSIHGGGPRRSFDGATLDLGDAEVTIPGIQGRLPVTGFLATELGAEVASGTWKMGHVGARLTGPIGADRAGQRAAADLELGAGLGSGGENGMDGGDGSMDPTSDELAYGGFVGAGFGTHGDGFGGFLRVRAQLTRSEDDAIPDTLWWSAVAGLQFGHGSRFRLVAGAAGYGNELQDEVIPVVEFGFELGRREPEDDKDAKADPSLPARRR